jgi:Uma2 family endonuclease
MMKRDIGFAGYWEALKMSTVPQSGRSGQRVMLHGISWDEYTQVLRAFAEQRSVRLTYDRGVLEIRTHSFGHHNSSRFLGSLISALTEEFNLPVASGGSTTLRRRKRQRGLEPDACFWIANEPRVRGLYRLNLRTDPPPDLVVEVDVTRSSLNRMAIYAALGVPEVWRLDVASLTFHLLQADGQYAASPVS